MSLTRWHALCLIVKNVLLEVASRRHKHQPICLFATARDSHGFFIPTTHATCYMAKSRAARTYLARKVRDTMDSTAKSNRSPIGVFVILAAAVVGLALIGWQLASASLGSEEEDMSKTQSSDSMVKEAIFAGGCFWCMESAFELMPGVTEAISGYTGGHVVNPTYQQVVTGATGHFEAVLVKYNPEQVSYEMLLDQYWRSVDPTDAGGQFYDRGGQYATAIFYMDEEQRVLAEASKQALAESGIFDQPIVTQILKAETFYVAEEYHQDYAQKYLAQYKAYTRASGRDAYLEETWQEDE